MKRIINTDLIFSEIMALVSSSRLRSILIFLISALTPAAYLQAQVVFDAASSNSASTGTTVTVSHTTGSGSNRLMLVGVSSRNRTITVGDPGDETTSVTYNGASLTFVGSEASNADAITYIFMLVNPPSGTANVVVTFGSALGGNNVGTVGVTTYSNVNQINPIGDYVSSAGSNDPATLTIPSTTTSQIIFNVLTVTRLVTVTPASGITQRWLYNGASTRPLSGGYTRAGQSGSTGISYGLSANERWSLSGVAVRPILVSDLQIAKTVNVSKPFAGQTVTFTLTATNSGPDAAELVEVEDMLPSGFTYISHTAPSGTTYTPGGGIWDIGGMTSGQSLQLTVQAAANSSGDYTNTATISGNVTDNVSANNTSSVTLVLCQSGGVRPLFSN
jgi:uncharacterized repeat protein (TIGR01451 family)